MYKRYDVEGYFMVEISLRSAQEPEAFSSSARAALVFPPVELILMCLFEVASSLGGPLRDSEFGGEAHGSSFT